MCILGIFLKAGAIFLPQPLGCVFCEYFDKIHAVAAWCGPGTKGVYFHEIGVYF